MATITDAGLTIAEAAARAGVSGLALLEAHREDVRERLSEVSRTLELIDYKIGLYHERVDRGDDLRC